MKKLLFFLMITISYNSFGADDANSLDDRREDSAYLIPTFVVPIIPEQSKMLVPAESIPTVTQGAVSSVRQELAANSSLNIFSRVVAASALLGRVIQNASAARVGDTQKTIAQLAHEGKLVSLKEQNRELFYPQLFNDIKTNILELERLTKELLHKSIALEETQHQSVQDLVSKLYAILEGVNKSQGSIERRDWATLVPKVRRALIDLDLLYQQQIERKIREARSFMFVHRELKDSIDQIETYPAQQPTQTDQSSQQFLQSFRRSMQDCRTLDELEFFQDHLYRLHYDLARKRSELLQRSRLK
jgi:hypothetical protein